MKEEIKKASDKWDEERLDEKEKVMFNLVSPTRGEKYELVDLLDKFFDRAGFRADYATKIVGRGSYGDYDMEICLDAEVDESLWTDSIYGSVRGLIPVHMTGRGKMSLGFRSNWGESDEYKKQELELRVTAKLEEKIEVATITFRGEDGDELAQGGLTPKEQSLLLDLIKEVMVREEIKTILAQDKEGQNG